MSNTFVPRQSSVFARWVAGGMARADIMMGCKEVGIRLGMSTELAVMVMVDSVLQCKAIC